MGLRRAFLLALAIVSVAAFARGRSVDSFQEPDEPMQSNMETEPEPDGERAPSAFADEPPPPDKPSDFDASEPDESQPEK